MTYFPFEVIFGWLRSGPPHRPGAANRQFLA
jgi:hypothetical protein